MKRSPLPPPTAEQIAAYRKWLAANMLRRAEVQRDTARTPVPRRGRKARREGPALARFGEVLRERSGGRCEAVRVVRPRTGLPVCLPGPHPGIHAHHVWPEDRDAGLHDPARGLFLCAQAHEYAHAFPADAAVAGLLRPDRATS